MAVRFLSRISFGRKAVRREFGRNEYMPAFLNSTHLGVESGIKDRRM